MRPATANAVCVKQTSLQRGNAWNCKPCRKTKSVRKNLFQGAGRKVVKIESANAAGGNTRGNESTAHPNAMRRCRTAPEASYLQNPLITMSARVSSAQANRRSSVSGARKSSASTKSRYSPCARDIPRLRAGPAPEQGCSTTKTRASLMAYEAKMLDEPSVEPSSTQMISISRKV